jgi:hypothetical protein
MENKGNNRIEEILGSLDGLSRASAPNFFYTRLRARMEKKENSPQRSWVLRPAYSFAALILILLINAAVILKTNTSDENSFSETDTTLSIASEYSINDNGFIYDLIQENN